jgi:formylmethanofuran--tetrahydromethanopterin N-formyltransferase
VYLASTFIVDTFAEAFRMWYARLVVTAHDEYWLEAAIRESTGYSCSVIGCDAEAGVDLRLGGRETPDGRPGASLLLFGFSPEALGKATANRSGQCLMTCPTTALYDGLPQAAHRLPVGKILRYFGDGFQKSKLIGPRRFWRIPVMDGEFLVEETVGAAKGVAGGNILIQAQHQGPALQAARRAVAAIDRLPGAITPFPAGVVRSGSKVGSRYKKLVASTSHAYCPTLRGRVETELHAGVNCVLEVVIDGVDELAVSQAMAAATRAAAGEGIVAISAGNYGGELGKFHFHLRQLLGEGG